MDAVGVVVGGHVGEDDLVAFLEAIEDLDAAHRRASKLNTDALPFRAVFENFEYRRCGICRDVDGPSDLENVIELFDVDGGVNWFRHGAAEEEAFRRLIQRNIHRDCTAYNLATNADDVPGREAALLCGCNGALIRMHLAGHGFRQSYSRDQTSGVGTKERSKSTDLPDHGASLHGVGPDGVVGFGGNVAGGGVINSAGHSASNTTPADSSMDSPQSRLQRRHP